MIVGVAMVKDEADVLPWTIKHMFRQGVDRLVLADNGSTDGTREFVHSLADMFADVTALDDEEPAYYQAEKMTRLVHGHCQDATWVVPFDADEHWGAADRERRLADVLDATTADVVLGQVWDYLPQAGDDASVADPFMRTAWRERHPETLPVVAFRYHPDAQVQMGNHDVRLHHAHERVHGLRVRHLQYRSPEQFARKLRNGKRAMELTTLDPSTCQHWRSWGALDDAELAREWDRLVNGQPLVFDPLVAP